MDTSSASWARATFEFQSGLVKVGGESDSDKVECLLYVLNEERENHGKYSAMPQLCPACQTNMQNEEGVKFTNTRICYWSENQLVTFEAFDDDP